MVAPAVAAEWVREALHHLYEPRALARSALAQELVRRGVIKSPDALYARLLEALRQLAPPPGAPRQAHGARVHRYLQLRYVECAAHEAAAQDLGLSLRQASRIHLDGLAALADQLVPSSPDVRSTPTPAGPLSEAPTTEGRAGALSLEAELAAVGRQPPEGAVDVAEVVQGAVETLGQVAADRGVGWRIELPPSLPPVGVNRVALRQILLNALLHEIRAGTGGQLELRASAGADAVVLRLARSGGAGDAEGVNEALIAAARYLVEQQGGALVRGGDAIEVRLPLGAVRTILVVDDNPDVGELFRRMLARSWYHPVPVRTAARALRAAAETPPDAVVLDVVMPGQDGWEVLAELKRDQRTSHVPIVVCSVLPDRDLAVSLGANDFLAKPITRAALLEVLERVFTA
jgi:CheY-like chemotaxis protein